MRTLNLGIVAHVDAGKTSLTERLLHAAGVIEEPGSVDAGSTQTDQLALERARGITIRSAVVSFRIGGVDVNLIDTPGHPDFIAEVERVLGVLDGAVLVVSAVEGVQAQTRVLFRTLERLAIPTLLFVNKIDRRGATEKGVLASIAERLTPSIIPMMSVRAIGTAGAAVVPRDGALTGADTAVADVDRAVADVDRADGVPADTAFADELIELLADRDDAVLSDYLDDPARLDGARLRRDLTAQVAGARVHPVLFGSAITGAGMERLMAAIPELLPATQSATDAPLSGTVFKIDRGPAGEKRAYVRLFSGELRVRGRLQLHGSEHKVTGIAVFDQGGTSPIDVLPAGRIGLVRGLGDVQIGDAIGDRRGDAVGGQHRGATRHFAPPSLEAVVDPVDGAQRGALLAALTELAEQDPLIALRQDDARQEIFVSLYGEVQKEVVQVTLADEYGLEVTFRETTTVCVERPTRVGEAVELSAPTGRTSAHPFLATVGLRVEPAPAGAGVTYGRAADVLGTMPAAFFAAIEESVSEALRQGVYGWRVVDSTVTLTHTGYWPRQSASHQTFDRAVSSVANDFRHLTPLVLMAALRRARTAVCEPIHRFVLDVPADMLGPVSSALASLSAVPRTSTTGQLTSVLEGDIPAGRIHDLQQMLPALTRGEGLLETELDRYEPVRGRPPARRRTDDDPRDREGYLLRVQGRVERS